MGELWRITTVYTQQVTAWPFSLYFSVKLLLMILIIAMDLDTCNKKLNISLLTFKNKFDVKQSEVRQTDS